MAYTDPTGHEALMEGSQIAGLILYCPESLEKTYLGRTLECLIFNNFSQEVTGAGIGIKVGLGVAGLDLPFDIVNIIADLCQYDDPKYKTRQEWWGNFALDALAFAPLIGLAKYAKYLTDAKAVFKPVMKKAGEIGEIIRSTGRKISGMDDVGEAVNQSILDSMNKSKKFYKESVNSYDCSEIADDLYNAAGNKGKIYEIKSKSGGLNVEEYGVKEIFDYHTVYSDGKYVYDPRYSDTPILEKDYFEMIEKWNPNGIDIIQQ